MKIVLSHPIGNANVRAVASGFIKANLMDKFHTTIATFPGGLLDFVGSIGPLAEIRRRRLDASLKPFTRLYPWYELGRLTASKAGLSKLIQHETGLFSIDSVIQNFDQHVASSLHRVKDRKTTAVYAYEDGAAFSFGKAQKLGIQCLYDLPIGYWRTARQLLMQERERWPEWDSTMTGFKDSEAKLARKDEELRLADQIFVASQFTAKTLQSYPGALPPVNVVPYGFPPVFEKRQYSVTIKRRPLKLLFVGGLSQRKGIANLFAAVDMFKHHVQLTVVGRKASDNCPALDAALAKHCWIPSMPHHLVIELMREQDVLVFPSLFEGFGLVITEAMSQGTPVITTDRTAGPDLITHKQNGWLVEAGSTQALQKTIEDLLRQPEQIVAAGQAAIETARSRPWPVYGYELAKVITQLNDKSMA